MLVMAFASGFFQALMPFIGWMFAKSFSHLIESVDHWIAFAILAFLGGRMIFESFKEEECCQLFNPTKLKVVFTMAIATSIDALATGISLSGSSRLYSNPLSYLYHRTCFVCHVAHRADLWYPMRLRDCPKVKSRTMGRYHFSHHRTKNIGWTFILSIKRKSFSSKYRKAYENKEKFPLAGAFLILATIWILARHNQQANYYNIKGLVFEQYTTSPTNMTVTWNRRSKQNWNVSTFHYLRSMTVP